MSVPRDWIICSTKLLKHFRGRYRDHALRARNRGISFELTFEQWMEIWLKSGQILNRGMELGQYVMGRNNDTGPYAVGNVSIITGSQNVHDANIRLSPGFYKRWDTKRRLQQSKVLIGRKVSEETRARMVDAAHATWATRKKDDSS
jgi:hypothetical protein